MFHCRSRDAMSLHGYEDERTTSAPRLDGTPRPFQEALGLVPGWRVLGMTGQVAFGTCLLFLSPGLPFHVTHGSELMRRKGEDQLDP